MSMFISENSMCQCKYLKIYVSKLVKGKNDFQRTSSFQFFLEFFFIISGF